MPVGYWVFKGFVAYPVGVTSEKTDEKKLEEEAGKIASSTDGSKAQVFRVTEELGAVQIR